MNKLTDDEGFLLSPQSWSTEYAFQTAIAEKLILTELHWKIIYFVREFYLQHQNMPKIRELIHYLQQDPLYSHMNSAILHQLFPYGPALQIAKISGLPKPTKCL